MHLSLCLRQRRSSNTSSNQSLVNKYYIFLIAADSASPLGTWKINLRIKNQQETISHCEILVCCEACHDCRRTDGDPIKGEEGRGVEKNKAHLGGGA
jgi:hypothetical protein